MSLYSTPKGKSEWSSNQDWQSAQERVLLYLRLLNLPGVEALEITLEALRRATSHPAAKDEHPVTISMRMLRNVLEERKAAGGRKPGVENRFRSICPWPLLLEKAGVPEDTKSMPPLNRGIMIPDRL